MGVLKNDETRVVLVSPGYHLIEAFTALRGVTEMTSVEVDKDEKTVNIQLKYKSDRQPKTQQAETPSESAGADPAANTTWTDPATGLMWTRNDNGSDVDWDQAGLYCSTLRASGLSGWRLPTLEELQGIYDPSVSAPTLFNDAFMVDVHVKGNLKLTGSTWSGLQGDAPGKPYQGAWLVQLGGPPLSPNVGKPERNFLHYHYDMRALCVRRPENVVANP